AVPSGAAVLVLAARKKGWTIREYLGLTLPKWRHVAIAFGTLVAFWGIVELAVYFYPIIDQSEVMLETYRAIAGNTRHLMLFWLVLVVTAPVAEEIIFRGFLMRGWGATRLGMLGALI